MGNFIREYFPKLPEIGGLTDDKHIEVPNAKEYGPSDIPADLTSADESEVSRVIADTEPIQ